MKEVLSSIAAKLLNAKKRYLIGGILLLSLAFNAASDSANYIKSFIDLLLNSKLSLESYETPREDGKSFTPSIHPDDIFIAKG